jgi:transposase
VYGVVLTNAMAESNNNYIQKLIEIGYGYTNFNRLRKRILYMSSNKNSSKD